MHEHNSNIKFSPYYFHLFLCLTRAVDGDYLSDRSGYLVEGHANVYSIAYILLSSLWTNTRGTSWQVERHCEARI